MRKTRLGKRRNKKRYPKRPTRIYPTPNHILIPGAIVVQTGFGIQFFAGEFFVVVVGLETFVDPVRAEREVVLNLEQVSALVGIDASSGEMIGVVVDGRGSIRRHVGLEGDALTFAQEVVLLIVRIKSGDLILQK